MEFHRGPAKRGENGRGAIALIGHHNVGKSVVFQRLTGRHVTVANYPGTTVEITRGVAAALHRADLIDTPGIITFPSHTEDEQATSRVLLEEPLQAVIQVGDAKNIRRTLLLTIQLAEMGLPMALALNMVDEADTRGVAVDHQAIADLFSMPVVPTVAVRGEGLQELSRALRGAISSRNGSEQPVPYPDHLEHAIQALIPLLPASPLAARGLMTLWLGGDPVAEAWLRRAADESNWQKLSAARQALEQALGEPAGETIQRARMAFIEEVASFALQDRAQEPSGLAPWIGRVAVHPIWGFPFLIGILAVLYWFVGHFGAGTLVDLLEIELFQGIINPWVADWVRRLIPIKPLADFLIGPYGLWSMGMTYALALILPIVSTFMLAFGVLEDSGYLPRLAVITNRLFSRLGLNGKAVLPMVLGLGCVTMATLTTRILESRRDRLLATLLLALAIPCSAQLGVVMGMLAAISLSATLIWAIVVVTTLLVIGWLASKLIPGERTPLMLELPPIRWPVASNLITKTLARVEWYLKEVVPLFLLGTAIMFTLDLVGILPRIIRFGEPLVTGWLGLPPEASGAFLMGFLRRDFGATGLFVMDSVGLLSPLQVVVSMITITLFIPCIASVFMIARERGWRMAAGMVGLVFPLSFLVGGLMYRVLFAIGWGS